MIPASWLSMTRRARVSSPHIFLRSILLFTRGGKGRSIFAPAPLSGDSTTIHEYYNSPMRTEAGEKPLAHHSRYRISKHRTAAPKWNTRTHPDKYGTIGGVGGGVGRNVNNVSRELRTTIS